MGNNEATQDEQRFELTLRLTFTLVKEDDTPALVRDLLLSDLSVTELPARPGRTVSRNGAEPTEPRFCAYPPCSREFVSHRSDTKFCSGRCRVAAYRSRSAQDRPSG